MPLQRIIIFQAETLPSRIWRDSRALLDSQTHPYDSRRRQIYEGALTYLNTVYIALLKKEDAQWTRRRLCGLAYRVPTGFIDLVQETDFRAMAILARFMALMKHGDGNVRLLVPEDLSQFGQHESFL